MANYWTPAPGIQDIAAGYGYTVEGYGNRISIHGSDGGQIGAFRPYVESKESWTSFVNALNAYLESLIDNGGNQAPPPSGPPPASGSEKGVPIADLITLAASVLA